MSKSEEQRIEEHNLKTQRENDQRRRDIEKKQKKETGEAFDRMIKAKDKSGGCLVMAIVLSLFVAGGTCYASTFFLS